MQNVTHKNLGTYALNPSAKMISEKKKFTRSKYDREIILKERLNSSKSFYKKDLGGPAVYKK